MKKIKLIPILLIILCISIAVSFPYIACVWYCKLSCMYECAKDGFLVATIVSSFIVCGASIGITVSILDEVF